MDFRVRDVVCTKPELSRCSIIAPKALRATRKPNARGLVTGLTDQYILVLHEDSSSPTAYMRSELEPYTEPYFWRAEYDVSGAAYFKECPTYDEAVTTAVGSNTRQAVILGPFFEDRPLTEGFVVPQSLYDYLLSDDNF